MKFEKLNENKIRIILTMEDLTEKNIDFHSFMSNSIESQDILLDMLEEAKKQTGFDPENFNLKIEALAMADTNFVFTITKVFPDAETEKGSKRKFVVRRKTVTPSTNTTQIVYMFNCFEDFCGFMQFLQKNNLSECINNIADSILLYSYKEKYYLILDHIITDARFRIKFYSSITEFAKCITNSKIFASKLKECGYLIMKHNALKIGFEHFAK